MENENSQNEYFLKREAKEKEVHAKETKSKMKKILVWAVFLLVVGFAVWKVVGSVINAPNIVEVKGDFFPAQSREHISLGAAHPEYNSDLPTGGWHYDTPAQAGIYDKELADEQLIHNLEHGHVWIAYRPDLDAETVGKLADIAKSYGSKIIMTPRAMDEIQVELAVQKEPEGPKNWFDPSKFILPGAILIAALLISGSIVFYSFNTGGNAGTADIKGVKVNVSIDDDPMLGNPKAKITLVEFSDFQCPYCRSFWSGAFPDIKKEYVDTGKVRFVYRDYPLSFHPGAKPAAEGGECADDQGKFWE